MNASPYAGEVPVGVDKVDAMEEAFAIFLEELARLSSRS